MVTAHPSTFEQKRLLRNLINQLKLAGKKIFLAAHVKVPDDIMEMVDFFYYREHNELLTDYEYKGYMSSSLHESGIPQRVWSKDFYSYNSILAVYHLIIPSLLICKLNGFEVVHMIEYDTDIQDFSEFDNNTKILKDTNFSSIIYNKDVIKGNFFMMGEFISLSMNKYSIEDLFIDDYKVKESVKINFTGELTSFDLLIKNRNYKVSHSDNIQGIKFGLHHSERAIMTCATVNEDGNIQVFSDNRHDNERHLCVVTSNDKVFNVNIKPSTWNCVTVGNLGDTKEVTIFINNKLLKVYKFNTPEEIDIVKRMNFFSGKN